MNLKHNSLLYALAVILIGVSFSDAHHAFAQEDDPKGVIVHFIDAGQGDATLLEGTDFTILIDAGKHNRSEVVPYLHSQKIRTIDLLIGTHPHADHIGQFRQVLRSFSVKEVWMSGDSHTSLTFERTLDAISDTVAAYQEPRAGDTFNFGSATLEILNPAEVTGDLNDGSIVTRVLFEELVLLFAGDAETHAEQKMMDRGHELTSHLLQVGHHGSRTSSTQPFLEAVRPEVAVYSAGKGNSFGHPHPEVIDRFENMGVVVYGTDVNGTILVYSDGMNYHLNTSRGDPVRAPPGVLSSEVSDCLNINTAINKEELAKIIHIGPATANEIIRLRPFISVDHLTRVNGIADHRLSDIKEQGLACVN